MSKQGTVGREPVRDAELDWDAVLQEPEAPGPSAAADEPVAGEAAAGVSPATYPAAPVADPTPEPDRSAVVSLGTGWSVTPAPGSRWGGTLRISETARALALATQRSNPTADPDPVGAVADETGAHPADEWDSPDGSGDAGGAAVLARRRPALRLASAGAPGNGTATGAGHRAPDRAARRRAAVDRAVVRAAHDRDEDPTGEAGDPGDRPAVGHRAPPTHRPSSEDLTPELLVRDRRSGPRAGLRGAVYRATGGSVNLGPSAAELRQRQLLAQVRTPISGCYRVAVVSLKGGVGKTTASFCLGATLASLRGDRVIAIDANPDVGTLAEHVVRQTRSNVWDLLAEPAAIGSYADVRAFTSQSPDRLEVLASARDPQLSHAFDAADYEQVMTLAERFYTMVVTDCGTGMVHSAMTGVLASVDQLVLVSSASLDGARSASATLDWLEAQGHGALAAEACVVVNSVRSRSAEVDVDRLAEHFMARSRAVVTVPYDPHLAQGTAIELGELQRTTRQAWVELAAAVVSDPG